MKFNGRISSMEIAPDDNNKTKITLKLTPKQVFVLQLALERYCDIDDSEYQKPRKIAEKVLGKLPSTGLKWNDVS